jgi:hypothetical protein
MIEQSNKPNDESRRTFLKALGVTGAATAGLGTLSDNAAAKSTTRSMNPLDIKADDIVPLNKYLSITVLDGVTKEIEQANVLVNDTQISSVQRTGENTFLLSVFDVLTNTDLMNSESVPVELQATTTDGNNLVGTDMVNVIDPTNVLGGTTDDVLGGTTDDVLGGTTDQVNDTVESTGIVGETTDDVVDSVNSMGILGESSADDRSSRAQMY